MLILALKSTPAALTKIPVTTANGNYNLTCEDSQPTVPINTGGLGVEIDGVAVALLTGHTISFDGVPVVTAGTSTYDVIFTCMAPNGGASFASLTITGLPAGVTYSVNLNSGPAQATVSFSVAPGTAYGLYEWNWDAVINNFIGAVSTGPWLPGESFGVTLDPANPATQTGSFALGLQPDQDPPSPDPIYPLGLQLTPPLTAPAGYTLYISEADPWLTLDILDQDVQEYSTLNVAAVGHLSPGAYPFAVTASYGGQSATLPLLFTVTAPVTEQGNVTGGGFMTIGPAWPPPQVLTTAAGVTLRTDAYAFSITQGDTLTIELFCDGLTEWSGATNLYLTDLDRTPPTVWPESALNAYYSFIPTPAIAPADFVSGQSVDIGTLVIKTTLTTPPGIYRFQVGVLPSNAPPSATLNVQILDAGNEAAMAPTNLPYGTLANPFSSSRRAQSGVVVMRQQRRTVLRALIMPCNRNSPGQAMARNRHLSITSAQAGQDDTAIAAWAAANAEFPGNVMMPGQVVDGVEGMGFFMKMTPAQYQYLCNQTQMGFGGAAFALPTINQKSMSYSTPQTSTPLGAYTLHMPASIVSTLPGLTLPAFGSVTPSSGQPPNYTATFTGDPTGTLFFSFGLFDVYNAELFSALSLTTPNGTYNMTAHITDGSTVYDWPFTITIANAPVTPPYPVRWFPSSPSASAHAVYDRDMQCIGFALTFTADSTGVDNGGYPNAAVIPPHQIICATAAANASKAAASGSGFAVIGYYTYIPAWPKLLEDWLAVYGTLPEKGRIYFSIQGADPVQGCTGPLITKGVSFKNGTLLGILKPAYDSRSASFPPAWTGPLFYQINSTEYLTIAPGSTTVTALALVGCPAIPGGGWSGGEPYGGTLTFKTATSSHHGKLPTDATIVFSPATLTIAPGDTDPHSVTVTITLPTGVGFTEDGCEIFLEATDGLSTASLTLHINGA